MKLMNFLPTTITRKIILTGIVGAIVGITYGVFILPRFSSPGRGIPQSAAEGRQETKEYRGSFVHGYEGDAVKISYTLRYPSPVFAVATSPEDVSTIELNEAGGRRHTIKIFNNVAAGFNSPAEAWSALRLADLCGSCKEVNVPFTIQGATGSAAWMSANREVVIFSHAPGFVIMNIEKPTGAERILETFNITAEKVSAPSPAR